MAGVTLHRISKRFGQTAVLRDVTLDVADGEFLAILGPSGCGKSTLLRILAGLEGCDSGSVLLGDEDVTEHAAKRRNLAMVFQSYALYPHMSVRQNIALPLELRRLSAWQRVPVLGRLSGGAIRDDIRAEVAQVARALALEPLLDRRPSQLSGGQRQRVALARAMVRHPAAFLMDEPLSNLDARLRGEARAEIVALQKRLGATVLYVTHDQEEAMAMADRVAVMREGRVLQVAAPQALYDDPLSLEVARFVGSPPMNAFPASTDAQGRVQLAGVPLPFRADVTGSVTLGVRPEALRLAAHGTPAELRRIERLGAEAILHAAIPGIAEPALARLPPEDVAGLAPGAEIALLPARAMLFDADGARLALHAERHEHAL
ncbi:ABC transporter ATP-binding protein [Falsiroseomonas sp.]|uniref:ABC transporter ATP-binding protein n=1 Tax=Falsiroseomonas sp. TaxID=2870721 RepID=UPI0034A31F2F